MRLPTELQEGIEQLLSGLDRRSLAHASQELSARYHSGEFHTPALTTAAHRAAYLVTRLPATLAANRHVFSQVRQTMPELRVESMLDLGAGPGTSLWAATETFPGIERIVAVERDRELADWGRRLAAASHHQALQSAEWVQTDLSSYAMPADADLIVVSYLLGELPKSMALQLLLKAWRAARKLVVVIEPGTPQGFATILAARQSFLDSGARISAPCPHHNVCPLAAAGDWCHFSERVERTAQHRQAKGGELGYEDEKFSYVSAAHEAAAWPGGRIVRHPLFRPGHVQLMLCTAEGLKKETVGKSQKDRYRRARKSEWGDAWAGDAAKAPVGSQQE